MSYVVSQIRPSLNTRSGARNIECWRFSTLVDCYEFLVGKLVREFGRSTRNAEAVAMELPLDLQDCTLTISGQHDWPYVGSRPPRQRPR